MEKMLPVNLDTGITTEVYNFIRLAAILSDARYLPWFIENFIAINVDQNIFTSDYYIHNSIEAMQLYSEVLHFRTIEDKTDICRSIREAIDNNGYVELYCDKYYIPGHPSCNTRHFSHEIAVIGYNDSEKFFHFLDMNINEQFWGIHRISFAALEESFYAAYRQLLSELDPFRIYDRMFLQLNLPASIFFLKPLQPGRKPNLELIYTTLQLSEGGETVQYPFEDFTIVKQVGLNIYRVYYENLKAVLSGDPAYLKEHQLVIWGLKRVMENKRGMRFRFQYLMDHGHIACDGSLLTDINRLCLHLEKAFNLLARFSNAAKSEFAERAWQYFLNAETLDREIHRRAKNLVFDAIRQTTFHPL